MREISSDCRVVAGGPTRALAGSLIFRKLSTARIVAWAERPGDRRLVVVHRNPTGFALSARGAIRNLWSPWQDRGLLAFVPEHLSPTTTWRSIRDALA